MHGEPGGTRSGQVGAAVAASVVLVVVAAAAVVFAAVRYDDGGGAIETGGVAGAQVEQQRPPERAPAFTAEQLGAEPTQWWITNGGTLSNQRYSPLDQIDTGNVQDLKGVWMTDLDKSGIAAKYSQEAQPLFYNGVLYVPTGEDDVFAVDVETGKVKWRYDGALDQKINTVCCGWLSRGVALGEGMVFLGKLDGSMVALDQLTGREVWRTQVGDWKDGYTITHAPLYYDGMVITGVSGGEFSIRGRVQALDAKTGKERWRFYTIPGPGETGHDTWPAGTDAWRHGGAPVWQTPAVDPELGLLYFSTGNASPDLDGSGRAGDNLFAASIVAVDAETGTYRWHFQQVRHDIWDYDAPSPVVLFDAEFDGERHKAIAESSKTGWTYVLDRETGEPLLPVEDESVPQDPVQKTARTQPIPQYDPFIPHDVTDEDVAGIRKLVKANASGQKPKVVKGGIYQPFREEVRAIVPGPQGGNNWQPMSYNPETGKLYICMMRSVSGYSRSGKQLPEGKQGQVADLGSVFTTTGFGTQTGYFGAFDPTTGEIGWQKRWPESCYAGSVSTGGGLVFVGRNGGHLEAYDAESGDLRWSFQTGAGANSTITTFEWKGTQYVAFASGGNALAATPHGDNLWLFSLEGTLDELAGAGPSVGVGHAGEAPTGPTDQGAGDAAAGEQVFSDNCAGCHGTSGTGGNGGPDLTAIPMARNIERVVAQVTNGGGGMPAFKGTLTQQQINDVSAYVVQRINGR
ncbi:MAG TPA: PQQ-binding-like beta-propeller repeat protein [Gaiellaceae bacterium]|nr:PQQ-binding-like beta-propeller repeat protein [Gaiellaceae bacterium]